MTVTERAKLANKEATHALTIAGSVRKDMADYKANMDKIIKELGEKMAAMDSIIAKKVDDGIKAALESQTKKD